MKKQFQILSLAITIGFLSCGKYNAEIKSTIKTEVTGISTNSCFISNETDLFLIDTEGQLRFNADPEDRAKNFQNRSSAGTEVTYSIARSGCTKIISVLDEPFGVN